MTRASAAKKLAAAAAFGGGGVTLVGGTLTALLAGEAALARKRIGPAELVPPDVDGVYGAERPGPEIRMVVLGDSAAAGYGVAHPDDTPAGRIAALVAEAADRRVKVTSVAVVGAETSDLDDQITKTLELEPHVAVIASIGANDVTHVKRLSRSVRLLRDGVRRMREAGVVVVVGTCPDLGTIQPIAFPLNKVAQSLSRRMAAAQAIAAVEAGGRTVSLADLLAHEFVKFPTLMFGPDQFHPSAAGYARLASVMAPAVVEELGLAAESAPVRGDEMLPIAQAAVAAAGKPGTQIEPADTAEHASRGRLGRMVQLRLRRRVLGEQ